MTVIVGLITTIAACFPALVMRLLDFVALYGLILMPMGAIIFIDFWVFPKIGLKSNIAELRQLNFNWAAGLTWFFTLGICLVINQFIGIEIFFLGLPGWFIAVFLYIGLSYLLQQKQISAVKKII